MNAIEEQCVCLKFCFKLGKCSNETFRILQQVFVNGALSRETCFEWFKRLKIGRTSIKDNEGPARPLTFKMNETVALACEII